jgi:hypothetical protein
MTLARLINDNESKQMPEKTQSFALKNNNASKDSSKKKGCC